MEETKICKVGHSAPDFEAEAFVNGEIKNIKLSGLDGKWKVVFFYPADFTFVCPTELGEMADAYEELQKMNVEVLSVSTDTVWVHQAWHNDSDTIKKIKFPMVADPTHKISKDYGVLIEDAGVTLRGTFLIDPSGKLRVMEVHEDGIGRSAKDLLRKIKAAQFVDDNQGQVCPASWEPGKETLKPGLDLVGKI